MTESLSVITQQLRSVYMGYVTIQYYIKCHLPSTGAWTAHCNNTL
jgi:hypothetical protein